MNPCNVLCSLLLSLAITAYIVIAVDSPPSRLSSCPPDQRDALIQLKNSFSITGPPPIYFDDACMNTSYPKTASWREDKNCCSWEGVTCDDTNGHIVGLDLSCARLRGAIDSNSSLFSLHHLRRLSLYGNDFISSSIPTEISVFSRMTYLNLSWSNVSGNVPTEISQLSKLVSLDLSYNFGLEVRNPTMTMLVQNLTQVEDLDLTYVSMSTVIPTSLVNFSSSLISLHLSDCGLGGKFPGYIFQLPNLQRLDLSWNYGLNGTLPESNWSTSLDFLSLGYCSFAGGVPHSVGTLPRLTSLDLSDCSFGGRFPENIFQLPNLQRLDLSWNSGPNGTLPESNWSSSLDSLSLQGCSFTGGVPNSIGTLPRLTSLDLSWNNFTSDVDFRTFSTLKNLRFLGLSQLSVSVDDATDANLSFPQLQTLKMQSCNLTKFPSLLSQLNKLRYLGLSGNRIEEIPSWFWDIGKDTLEKLDLSDNLLKGGGLRLPWKRLGYLSLQNNSFEGPLPIPTSVHMPTNSSAILVLEQQFFDGCHSWCLGNLTDLRDLDLSSNSLKGPLPLPSFTTEYYSVSENNFSGKISSLVCNATNLYVLDLSNNCITGTLPSCLKNITMGLEYLNLRMNKFHGLIPEIFPELSSLTSLDFSRNQFEGSLPRSLSNCQSLEELDVGSNKIVDSFPDWLGDLPFKILSLRSNKFRGHLTVSQGTCLFSELRILDLSNNGFEGNLSDNLISKMFGMARGDGGNATEYMIANDSSEYYSVMIDLKGVETYMVKINAQFATLDVSSNYFCGEIPRNIGLLKSLKSLNFSHNSFVGTIPPSLGNLTNLESLDLSSNHLVGEIPKELVKLTSLGALDLSRNNLTGHIPSGGHLNTFSNSFEGNPGLCGIPLTRLCGQGRAKAQPLPDHRHNGKDKLGGWFEWTFVTLGFGSGMGIGISLGYMALEIGRPLWLARMVIRLEGSCRKKSKRKASRRNSWT